MKYALLGTGLMGYPMAEVLLGKNYELMVYNRTEDKLKGLLEKGAQKAERPIDAINFADIIILMLSDAQAIEESLFGDKTSFSGKTIIQMGTISSRQSRDFEERIRSLDGRYMEAPVLGSIKEVKSSTLMIMVGGRKECFDNHISFLKTFCPEPIYIGETGSAATLKLAYNQLIASLTSAFSLSLGLIRESSIDMTMFMDILRKSSLYAPQFDKKLNKMLHRDFQQANFPVEHLLKDVKLCVEEAQDKNIETKSLQGLIPILEKAIELGFKDHDYSALYNAIHKEKS